VLVDDGLSVFSVLNSAEHLGDGFGAQEIGGVLVDSQSGFVLRTKVSGNGTHGLGSRLSSQYWRFGDKVCDCLFFTAQSLVFVSVNGSMMLFSLFFSGCPVK
jgi:hypothetical protein